MTRVRWKYVVLFVSAVFLLLSGKEMMCRFMELENLDENLIYIYKDPLMTETLAEQAVGRPFYCEVRLIRGNTEIRPEGPGRSVKGHAVYTGGNKILDMYLGSDKSACVLSYGLAASIFGSGDIKGNIYPGKKIRYEGKTYDIKGIIHGESPVLFLNPKGRTEDSQAETGVVLLRNMAAQNYSEAGNLFGGGAEMIDVDFMKWLLQSLLCIFFLWVLRLLLKLTKSYGKKHWLNIAVTLALWMVFMKLFIVGAYVFPIRILPSKWSDFEGWRELADSVFMQFFCIIRYRDLPVIDRYYEGFNGCLFSLLLTGVLLKITMYCGKEVRI